MFELRAPFRLLLVSLILAFNWLSSARRFWSERFDCYPDYTKSELDKYDIERSYQASLTFWLIGLQHVPYMVWFQFFTEWIRKKYSVESRIQTLIVERKHADHLTTTPALVVTDFLKVGETG